MYRLKMLIFNALPLRIRMRIAQRKYEKNWQFDSPPNKLPAHMARMSWPGTDEH